MLHNHYSLRFQGILLLLLIPLFLGAQAIQDVTVNRERTFVGAGLYGFMNGGSDLYLEYGFEKLTTRDVQYKDEEYTVDIYEMSSPENAFGIYSLHTFKCLRADTLGYFNCLSAYQFQAVAGNRYISVVFPSGSAKARKNADELFSLYINPSGLKRIDIPERISLVSPYSSRLKYLKGNLSVSNAQPTLHQWLEGISYSCIWLEVDKPVKGNKALIYPSGDEDIEALKKRIPKEEVIEYSKDYIYVKCPKKEEVESHDSFGF